MVNLYKKRWAPNSYLSQYYTTETIAQDERGIFRFTIGFLKKKKVKFDEMIEIGCGPTIHHVLPFVPYARRIYLADYMKSNLREIQKWIRGSSGAHDWTPYLKGVLSMEGKYGTENRNKRILSLKNKIVKLLQCNVLNKRLLSLPNKTFELVTSFYCLECVAHNKKEWQTAMRSISNLVSPKGWIILGAVHNTNGYKVGNDVFPTVRVTKKDMYSSLIASGFIPKTISVKVCRSSEWSNEGFSSIIVCRGQKK